MRLGNQLDVESERDKGLEGGLILLPWATE